MFSCCCSISNRVKGVLTLIAGFCIHLMIGSEYTWSAINVYYASYLKYRGNPTISISDVYFLMPCLLFLQYALNIIGVKIEEKWTIRASSIICVLCIISAWFIYLFNTNFTVIICGFLLNGFGNGVGFLSLMNNGMKYFPNKEGMANGVIIAGLGLSAGIFNPIADYMINSQKAAPLQDGFYSEEISANVHNFLKFTTIVFVVCGVIGICFTFPFQKETLINENQNVNENDNNNNLLNTSSLETTISFKEALKSKQNFQLAFICFATPFFCLLLSNTNRYYGNLNQIDAGLLQIMSFIFALLNGICRFGWGYLFDIISYKVLIISILIVELIVSISITFIASIGIVYVIENCLIGICLSGSFTLMVPIYKRIFGIKQGARVFGISGISAGIAVALGPIVAKLFAHTKDDYRIIYIGSSLLIILCMINTICFDDKNSFYGDKNNSFLKEISLSDMNQIQSSFDETNE